MANKKQPRKENPAMGENGWAAARSRFVGCDAKIGQFGRSMLNSI